MNSIGNHCIGKNLRVLLVNNGKGIEFRHLNHQAAFMGDDADDFVAAAGHWGNQSHELVKHYAQDLGFKYLTASSKEDFEKVYEEFLDDSYKEKPILFEVFTTTEDEQDCLVSLMNANVPVSVTAKRITSSILGKDVMSLIKKIVK